MRIARAVADAMIAHARAGYPFEVCGALLGRNGSERRVEELLPLQNRELAAPRVRYQIAPEDLLRVQRAADLRGHEIVGFYHSHPDHPARPSETDRRIAAEGLSDGVVHVVVGVEMGRQATPTAWVFRDATQAFEEEPLDLE